MKNKIRVSIIVVICSICLMGCSGNNTNVGANEFDNEERIVENNNSDDEPKELNNEVIPSGFNVSDNYEQYGNQVSPQEIYNTLYYYDDVYLVDHAVTELTEADRMLYGSDTLIDKINVIASYTTSDGSISVYDKYIFTFTYGGSASWKEGISICDDRSFDFTNIEGKELAISGSNYYEVSELFGIDEGSIKKATLKINDAIGINVEKVSTGMVGYVYLVTSNKPIVEISVDTNDGTITNEYSLYAEQLSSGLFETTHFTFVPNQFNENNKWVLYVSVMNENNTVGYNEIAIDFPCEGLNQDAFTKVDAMVDGYDVPNKDEMYEFALPASFCSQDAFISLRATPSENSEEIGVVYNFDYVEVWGVREDWLFVSVNDSMAGWVPSNCVLIGEEDDCDIGDSEYIIPDSDKRYLTEADLLNFSSDDLRYARNEIYARHGRMFNSQDLQDYFLSKTWYVPSISPDDFNDNMLNDYERENASFIKEHE